MKTGLCSLFLAIFSLSVGCGAAAHEEARKSIIYLVFDPTSLDVGQEQEMRSFLERVGGFYLKVPMDSTVITIVVGDRQPVTSYAYPFRSEFSGQHEHEDELKKDFKSIEEQLLKAWREAHSPSRLNVPASCLLSSLDSVILDKARFGSADADFCLILLSDMLESCGEGGENINVEAGHESMAKLRTATVRLQGFSRVIIVELPNSVLTNREDMRSLRQAWEEVLLKGGVDAKSLSYSNEFPDNGWFPSRGTQ